MKIIGNTVGTPLPKSDLAQTDPRKGDYVKSRSLIFENSIVCEAQGSTIAVNDSSDRQLQGLVIYGNTTQNGTPTPDAPIPLVSPGDGGNIKVSVTGKNLLTLPYSDKDGKELYGITYTVNDDGSMYVSGASEGGSSYFRFFRDRKESFFGTITEGGTNGIVTASESLRCNGGTANLHYAVGETANTNTTVYPQIEFGTVRTAWEAPKQEQSVTVSTPNGLKGIGDVKDEIDFARGLYTQKVNELVFDGTEDWVASDERYPHLFHLTISKQYALNRAPVLCSHYPYDQGDLMSGKNGCRFNTSSSGAKINRLYISSSIHTSVEVFKTWLAEQYASGTPVKVRYVLNEPLKPPLSEAELSAFAALRTHKPNTSIFNDGDAEMKVSYTADTKTYIDNKFNALASAIVNNT